MKLCKDCKHYKIGYEINADKCYRNGFFDQNLIRSDEPTVDYLWCVNERENDSFLYKLINQNPCGKSGKYWEQK